MARILSSLLTFALVFCVGGWFFYGDQLKEKLSIQESKVDLQSQASVETDAPIVAQPVYQAVPETQTNQDALEPSQGVVANEIGSTDDAGGMSASSLAVLGAKGCLPDPYGPGQVIVWKADSEAAAKRFLSVFKGNDELTELFQAKSPVDKGYVVVMKYASEQDRLNTLERINKRTGLHLLSIPYCPTNK